MEKKIKRSSTWTCVIYPGDSAPSNYLDVINSFRIPVLISPLHQPDKEDNLMDPDSGEMVDTRKPHQHVFFYFSSLKSFDQVLEYSKLLNAARPFVVHSSEAMIRYFIHWDDPDKEQFYDPKKEIKENAIDKLLAFNGFEYQQAFSTYTNEDHIYDYIESLVMEKKIANLIDLLAFLKEHKMKYEIKFVRTHTMYTRALLDGQYHKLSADMKKGTVVQDYINPNRWTE